MARIATPASSPRMFDRRIIAAIAPIELVREPGHGASEAGVFEELGDVLVVKAANLGELDRIVDRMPRDHQCLVAVLDVLARREENALDGLRRFGQIGVHGLREVGRKLGDRPDELGIDAALHQIELRVQNLDVVEGRRSAEMDRLIDERLLRRDRHAGDRALIAHDVVEFLEGVDHALADLRQLVRGISAGYRSTKLVHRRIELTEPRWHVTERAHGATQRTRRAFGRLELRSHLIEGLAGIVAAGQAQFGLVDFLSHDLRSFHERRIVLPRALDPIINFADGQIATAPGVDDSEVEDEEIASIPNDFSRALIKKSIIAALTFMESARSI